MMFCASLGAQRQSSSWRVCQCEGDPGDTEHTRCHVLRECMVALADGRSVGAASTVQRNIIYIAVFCISLFREGPYSVFQICGNPCIPRIPYSRKIPVEHCQGLFPGSNGSVGSTFPALLTLRAPTIMLMVMRAGDVLVRERSRRTRTLY